jgi:TRAP-type uncharacterized transport system substrate-binding protein
MRPIALAILMLFTTPAATAEDEESTIRIASGIAGGTYRDVYAENLASELDDFKIVQRETSGSSQNFELLVAGKTDLAFVQADIYASRMQEEPFLQENMIVLGQVSEECIYIAARADGGPKNLKELTAPTGSRPAMISVGPEESGMDGSWDYLVTLKPALAEVSVMNADGTAALEKLKAGEIDAVGWVTDPSNFNHNMLRAVQSSKALTLMQLDDPKLANVLPDGTRVYAVKTVKTTSGWLRPEKLATVCTSALLVTRNDRDEEMLEEVRELMQEQPGRIAQDR